MTEKLPPTEAVPAIRAFTSSATRFTATDAPTATLLASASPSEITLVTDVLSAWRLKSLPVVTLEDSDASACARLVIRAAATAASKDAYLSFSS